MRTHQQGLIHLLTKQDVDFEQETLALFKKSNSNDLANIFVDVAFLLTGLKFVQEQYLLQSKEKSDEIIFASFVKKFFKVELAPLLFFHFILENSSIQQVEIFRQNALAIQNTTIKYGKALSLPENKIFAVAAMKLMSELFEFEHQLLLDKKNRSLQLGYSLYRTFDALDDFFHLDQGVGRSTPQTSYGAILLVLRYLKIPTGARFVDLGAGFDRAGLAVRLLRPDIDFVGYGLDEKDFIIPDAEIYYVNDFLSEETYTRVVAQLSLIGARKKIHIMTMGSARQGFQGPTQRARWSHPQEFESGHFSLFRSH